MNNERSLTIQVRRELVRLSTKSGPVGQKAASELMELSHEEIRLALGETLQNPVALCPIIENSMSLNGSGGPSLLAALEPEEIRAMTRVSRQIFADEFIFMDTENGVYYSVSEEFVRKIFADPEANRNLLARLKFLGSSFETSTEKAMKGPWAILGDEVAIRWEAVLDYLLSIRDVDRLTYWKVAAVKAMGLELVAYAVKMGPADILTICRDISEELFQDVDYLVAITTSDLLKANLIESHLEAVEETTVFSPVSQADIEGFVKGDVYLDKAVDDLLTIEAIDFKSETFGTLDADDIEDTKQANGTLQRLLKKGLPDPEEK